MRFASHLGSLTDYTYDVPAFYSPGWFWVVGAGSAATGVPAWHVYKWVAIGSLYVAGAIAFWLWRRTSSTRLSALLVAVTTIALPSASGAWLGGETLLFAGAYEPYGWLVALPLPALLTWYGAARSAFSWRRGVLLGLAVAAAAYLYLLYALVAVVGVAVLLVWRGRTRARLLEVLVGAVTAAVAVSPWLGVFLVAWLRAGRPKALATTWISGDSYVHLVTPAATPGIVVALVGAVGMVALSGTRQRGLLGAQATAAAVLVLGVAQLLLGQVGAGVLFHRLLLVFGVALLAGGTVVVATAGPRLAGRLRDVHPLLVSRRLAAAVLAVAALFSLTGHATEWMAMNDLRKLAQDVPLPDESFPPLASTSTRQALAGQPSVDSLAEAARDVARQAGRPVTAPVLTDDEALLATSDLFGYEQWWELYANPLGRYAERKSFLQGLAGRSPEDVVRTLRQQPDAPVVFVLKEGPAGATFSSTSWTPAAAQSTPWTVTLPAGLFDRPDFVTRRVGDWTVAALRRG
jgi:galactan 5-O-arabinofuranosyltransferase